MLTNDLLLFPFFFLFDLTQLVLTHIQTAVRDSVDASVLNFPNNRVRLRQCG